MTELHPRISECVVISLAAQRRMAGFYSQDGSSRFRVFDAIDGRSDRASEIFDLKGFSRLVGWDISFGEIGCAASHYSVIKEFAESDGPGDSLALIVEDDARFHPDFCSVVNKLAARDDELGILVLGAPGGRGGSRAMTGFAERAAQVSLFSRILVGDSGVVYRYGHADGAVWCAAAVLVSRHAARRVRDVVESSQGVQWVADDFSRISRVANVDLKVLRPPLVDFVGVSTIRSEAETVGKPGAGPLTLRERLAFRTRSRSIRGVVAATLEDLARVVSPHPDGKKENP